jgi:triphosphoribosyl-dephospho-CoA synthase
LVDRHDSGAHSDLSFEGMNTSINLLPRYFEELLQGARLQTPLEGLVQTGLEAEHRMVAAIQSNGHKGYIFLSGLVLMAACASDGSLPSLRVAIAALAGRFFERFEAQDTHGATIRSHHFLGGIRAEALAGLPSVFEVGWPRYREALEAGWSPQQAAFYLMGILMQCVEDTTTISRGGLAGLARLRRDGAELQNHLEQRRDPVALLAALNEDYCRLGLTMGGVADCMALTFALQGSCFP